MKIRPLNWLGLTGCIGTLALLAWGAVSMVRFATHVDTVEDSPGLLCSAMAEDRFAVVPLVTNPRFIHFDKAMRILYDARSLQHFTDVELARARFEKPRIIGRTKYLTIVALGDIIFLVSNDQKIQSIVRRKRFNKIRDKLIRDISEDLAHRASEREEPNGLKPTLPALGEFPPTKPNQSADEVATPSAHNDIPTSTAGPR